MRKIAFFLLIFSILSILLSGVIKINETLPTTIRSKAELKFTNFNNPYILQIETKYYFIRFNPDMLINTINTEASKLNKFKDDILNNLW